MTQTGGNVVITSSCGDPTHCSLFNIGNQGGTGTYNLSGGTLVSGGFYDLGRNSGEEQPASTGTLNLSGTGAVSVTDGSLILGDWNNPGVAAAERRTINQTGGIIDRQCRHSLSLGYRCGNLQPQCRQAADRRQLAERRLQ